MKTALIFVALMLSLVSYCATDKIERGNYVARLTYVESKFQYRVVSEFENDFYTNYRSTADAAFENAKKTGCATVKFTNKKILPLKQKYDRKTLLFFNKLNNVCSEDDALNSKVSYDEEQEKKRLYELGREIAIREAVEQYKEDVALGELLVQQRDAAIAAEQQRQFKEQEKIDLLYDIRDEMRWRNWNR